MTTELYCRESKAGKKDGKAPIQIAISIDGVRKFYNLPIRYNPKDFKKEMESRKDNDLKKYVESVKRKYDKAAMEMECHNIVLNHNNLRDYIREGGIRKTTVQDIFDRYIETLKDKVPTELTEGAYKKYINSRNLFYSYIETKGIKKEDSADKIDNYIAMGFHSYVQKNYKQSSISGIMTRLKVFFKKAAAGNKIQSNPFEDIKVKKAKPVIEYLTDEELETLKNKDMHSDRLNKVRDLCVFQAASGLSYCDMAELRKEDIQYDEENNLYFIRKKRKKTGIEFYAVILKDGVEVLKRYHFDLQVLTNQRYNSYLKEIQTLAGIGKTLHTHLFRKTYATRLLRTHRAEVVAKCLGHSNTRITLSTYAKVEESTILKEFRGESYNL